MVGVPAALVVLASSRRRGASRSSNPSSDAISTECRETGAALLLLHRAVPSVTLDPRGHAGHTAADAIDLGLGLLEGRELGRTQVDLEDAAFSHHVRAGAPSDDVHGHPGPATVQRLHRDRRFRGREHRTAPFSGSTPACAAPDELDSRSP